MLARVQTWPRSMRGSPGWRADQGGHVHRRAAARPRPVGERDRSARRDRATASGGEADLRRRYCRRDDVARLHAALLMAGDGALLSHQRGRRAEIGLLEQGRDRSISRWSEAIDRCRGFASHRAHLRPNEVIVRRGLPMTSVGRTLFDLAGSIESRFPPGGQGRHLVRHLTDTPSLADAARPLPGRPGASVDQGASSARDLDPTDGRTAATATSGSWTRAAPGLPDARRFGTSGSHSRRLGRGRLRVARAAHGGRGRQLASTRSRRSIETDTAAIRRCWPRGGASSGSPASAPPRTSREPRSLLRCRRDPSIRALRRAPLSKAGVASRCRVSGAARPAPSSPARAGS